MNQTRRLFSTALCGAAFCAFAGALLPGAAHAQTLPFTVNTDDDTVKHAIDSLSETLTWQKCQIGRSGEDCDIINVSEFNRTWYEAWAAAFAANPEGDVNGWRMPSQHELYRLYFDGEQTLGQPFNAAEFPNASSSLVWSGSPHAGNSNYAWVVSFSNGSDGSLSRYSDRGVRLVRAGQCFGALAPLARPAAPTVTVTPNGADLEFSWAEPTAPGQAVLWSDTEWGTGNHSTEAANGLGGSCTANLTAADVSIEAYAYSTDGGASWTVEPAGSSTRLATIPGAAGANFDFRLTAINTGGLWSEMFRVNQNGTFHSPSTFEGKTATGSGTARAEIVNHDAIGCQFDATATRLINASGTPQANVYFPHGLLDFTLIHCAPGETAEIKITWPSSLAGSTYWKDKGTSWEKFTADCADNGCASFDDNKVVIYVTDGGTFDLDGEADGSIRDPNGGAWPKAGAAGGTPIPVLPAPLPIMLGAALAALAGLRLHKKQARSPQD